MTPIRRIAWHEHYVYTEDSAGYHSLAAIAPHEEQAEWLAWSLGRAHQVAHERLAEQPRLAPGQDPYTRAARLCDDDGVARSGPMHHGKDYPCTGHAHFAGDHIQCTSSAHTAAAAGTADAGMSSRFLAAVRRGDIHITATNLAESSSDAARRFAGELERLLAGLAERGITPPPDSPVATAAVDAALAALDSMAGDPFHVVEFREGGWTIKHPLSCRPNLFDCPVNQMAQRQFAGPPASGVGRYRCDLNTAGDGLLLEAVAGG